MSDSRRVYELIDRLPPVQRAALETLLEAMLDDDVLSEDDRRAVAASRDHFRAGGRGIPFEQVVSECGFAMDEIRNYCAREYGAPSREEKLAAVQRLTGLRLPVSSPARMKRESVADATELAP